MNFPDDLVQMERDLERSDDDLRWKAILRVLRDLDERLQHLERKPEEA